mmetsp:Transcript_14012/g.27085  ORF Transcript_14012/g.27085 Transcript_14012/m.27085 type:complete len:458 (+) Transcript_14012:76-1449(+)
MPVAELISLIILVSVFYVCGVLVVCCNKGSCDEKTVKEGLNVGGIIGIGFLTLALYGNFHTALVGPIRLRRASAWTTGGTWMDDTCEVLAAGVASRGRCPSATAASLGIDSYSVCPGWTKCSDEGGQCMCSGDVAYGSGLYYRGDSPDWKGTLRKESVKGPINCTNAAFGSDPAPYTNKYCWCLSSARLDLIAQTKAGPVDSQRCELEGDAAYLRVADSIAERIASSPWALVKVSAGRFTVGERMRLRCAYLYGAEIASRVPMGAYGVSRATMLEQLVGANGAIGSEVPCKAHGDCTIALTLDSMAHEETVRMHEYWERSWSLIKVACMASTVSGLAAVWPPPYMHELNCCEAAGLHLVCVPDCVVRRCVSGPTGYNLGFATFTFLIGFLTGLGIQSTDFAGTGPTNALLVGLFALTAVLLHCVWPLLITRFVHLMRECSLCRGDEVSLTESESESE